MPSVSKKQQKYFGMIHACQKYGKCTSPEIKKKSKEMKPGMVKKFAKTKHSGLPTFKEWLVKAENYFIFHNKKEM